jgi:hypothetical protein
MVHHIASYKYFSSFSTFFRSDTFRCAVDADDSRSNSCGGLLRYVLLNVRHAKYFSVCMQPLQSGSNTVNESSCTTTTAIGIII